MKQKLFWTIVALLATAGSQASAQWGGGWGAGFYGSTTIQEGVQRGFADVVRSQGMANLYNSEAAINAETAYSKDLVNQRDYVQMYFDTRRMNDEYRAAERGKPATSEQMFRWAHRDAPQALNTYEFDPLSGQVNWPIALLDPSYAKYRNTTEQYFKARVQKPQSITFSSYEKMQELAENWLVDLKSKILNYKPNDYLRARKFIESLSAEASKS
jgi:hypothetical protein